MNIKIIRDNLTYSKFFIKKLLKILFFIFLFLQPIAIYILSYPKGDCDDKAVHYYSAAFFYASPGKKENVIKTIPVWLEKGGSVNRQQRIRARLSGSINYIAANTLIKYIRNLQFRYLSGRQKNFLYTKCIKPSFLIMLFFSMGYLIFLSNKTPFGVWPMLLILSLTAYSSIRLPLIVSMPYHNMHPFTSYVPRGSATLFVLSIFLSYASNKKLYFVLSSFFLFLWNAGFAFLLFLTIGIVFLIAEVIPNFFARDKEYNRFNVSFYYPLTILFLGLCAIFPLGKILYLHASPLTVLVPVGINSKILINSILAAAVLIALVYLFMRSEARKIENKFSLRFFLANATFLIIASCQNLFAVLPSLHFLASKIYSRLSGLKYLILVTLVVFLFSYFWDKFKEKIVKLRRHNPKISAIVICIMLIVVVYLLFGYSSKYKSLNVRKLNYFSADCGHVKKIPLNNDTLFELNPKREAEFFYSLGEYLFDKNSN